MRLTVEEAYPGEAHEKAGELFKALARRLGGRARMEPAGTAPVHPGAEPDPHGGAEHVHEEKNPIALSRDYEARMQGIAAGQIRRMVADVARLVAEKRAKNARENGRATA
jgi:hypothetical protein